MSHISSAVEYGLHCLLRLVNLPDEIPSPSARDLADLQGLPADYVSTVMTKLNKAGITKATEGLRGGIRLARPAEQISFLDVVTAIDGPKKLFECRDVRERCALFGGSPPEWASSGVCSIHAVMLAAEAEMRRVLASRSLADVAAHAGKRVPPDFIGNTRTWMVRRGASRRTNRPAGDGGTAKSR